MKTKYVAIILILLAVAYANGGNQKYVEGYLVQISNLPISPFAGEKVSMLVSFANTSGDLLRDIEAKIRINQNDNTIFESNFTEARTGVMKFDYTFEKPGLYDVIVEFRFIGSGKVFTPDHFLFQARASEQYIPVHIAAIATAMFLIGIVAGIIFGRRLKR